MRSDKKIKQKFPALFIGHGSPLNIISDNLFTQNLRELGNRLPTPKAIVVISAHWLTSGTKVLSSKNPRTIYDFYGFPRELYTLNYPSPGEPELAKKISQRLASYGVVCEENWGYDHASWAILTHIYPQANIPVIELSLDYGFNNWELKPIDYHFQLAKNLAFLREEEVLIIGSGNIVHNLGRINYEVDAPIMKWAKELDEKVKENIKSRNYHDLIHFQNMGEIANLGIPTWDHYLPMIYILALCEEFDSIQFAYEGFQHGSISMRCFSVTPLEK